MDQKLSTKVDNSIMDTTVDSSKADEIQRNSGVEQVVEFQQPDTSSANLLASRNSINVDPLSPQTTFQPGTQVVNPIIDTSGAEVVQQNSGVEQVVEFQPIDASANLLSPATNPINVDPPPNSRITRRFVKPMSQEAILQLQTRVENVVQPESASTSMVPPTMSFDFPSGRGNNGDRRQRGSNRKQSNCNNQLNGFNRNPKFNDFPEAQFEQPNVELNDKGWIIHDRGNKDHSPDFQADAVYNVSNGHDAWTCFENLEELTRAQKEIMKDVENKLKRDAQDNFFPFLQQFFEKKVSFIYEDSKRMDLLRKLLKQELEKASLNIPYLPCIIVNTQSDAETVEVVSVIQNFIQKIPFITLSDSSTIDEVEDATEQLFDKRIKILVVNSLCFVGKMDVYCDKVINYSAPTDIENFVLRMQNIKQYYECENFILTQIEVDLIYQFAEIFKGAGFHVPFQLKGFDVVPEGKTCPPLRDALINIYTGTQHDFLTFNRNQKYAAVANYLKQLKDHAFNGNSLPRVVIYTNGYEETAKLTTYLKERNIACASINYDSSERDIKSALSRFFAKTEWLLIISDLIVSEEDFMSDIVLNFSVPNIITEYVMRIHNIRHVAYDITYVSSYYDRFLLRNVANLLKSGHFEIPSTLKEINAWNNCGSSKIDCSVDTVISNIPDDALLISSTYEKFLMIEERDKLNNCFELLQENFKKVGGKNIELMPKTLIVVNTKKEAESLVDLLECSAYPCIYIPLNSAEEDIQQCSKYRINIIHENHCKSLKSLHYDYLVHYEMPNDVESYLLRLKQIQHEKSVVFATKGKDSEVMAGIINILASSEHISHFVNTLRENNEDGNAGNDNDDEMESKKKDDFETYEGDVVEFGENEDIEGNEKGSIVFDGIEDGI
uniref:Uncharacterized protein n=1 Tax=Panagrolaimus sp. PS1159 TaxID=55785 RepID=A0AC35GTK8_9BILA